MTTRSPPAPGSPCANRSFIRVPRQRPTCCRRGRTAAHPARPSCNGERSRLPPRPARAALAEGHLRRPGGSCRLLRARRCRQTASSQTTARWSGAARVCWWNSGRDTRNKPDGRRCRAAMGERRASARRGGAVAAARERKSRGWSARTSDVGRWSASSVSDMDQPEAAMRHSVRCLDADENGDPSPCHPRQPRAAPAPPKAVASGDRSRAGARGARRQTRGRLPRSTRRRMAQMRCRSRPPSSTARSRTRCAWRSSLAARSSCRGPRRGA